MGFKVCCSRAAAWQHTKEIVHTVVVKCVRDDLYDDITLWIVACIVVKCYQKTEVALSPLCLSFVKLSQNELSAFSSRWCHVEVLTDKLTRLLLHRWEAEDVGVWCSSRSLCAPHIHSVYDIPSLVSWPVYFLPLFFHYHPPHSWNQTLIFSTQFELNHPLPYITAFFFASSMPSCCESSSYCAKVHRSLKAQESGANGTVVWKGQNADEMIYTCPNCQELAQSSNSSS